METLQQTMEELLKKFGTMAADVKAVSGEVHGLRQQFEDFGTDLDGVKRRLTEPAKAAAQPRVEILQANKGVAAARLTNNGPPLLDVQRAAAGYVPAPSSPTDGANDTPAGDFVILPR
jgi:hypothetical protein